MSQILSRPAAAALVAAGLSIAAPAQALQYTLTDLGIAAGYGSSQATSVNDQGQVVGNNRSGSPNKDKSFVWTAGTGMQLLTPLTQTGGSYVAMINDSGVIVGSTDFNKATLWSPTGNGYTATGLGFVPGRQWGQALDVNSSGQAVGYYVNGNYLNPLG
jgi:uncharacterized membrane protein